MPKSSLPYLPKTKEEFIKFANARKDEVIKAIEKELDSHIEAMMFPRQIITYLDEFAIYSTDFLKHLKFYAEHNPTNDVPDLRVSVGIKNTLIA